MVFIYVAVRQADRTSYLHPQETVCTCGRATLCNASDLDYSWVGTAPSSIFQYWVPFSEIGACYKIGTAYALSSFV